MSDNDSTEREGKVVLVAEMTLGQGEKMRGIAALRELRQTTLEDDEGCAAYRICRVREDPLRIVTVEEWTSDEALQAHRLSPHVAAFRDAGVLNGPPRVLIMDELRSAPQPDL